MCAGGCNTPAAPPFKNFIYPHQLWGIDLVPDASDPLGSELGDGQVRKSTRLRHLLGIKCPPVTTAPIILLPN